MAHDRRDGGDEGADQATIQLLVELGEQG